MVRSVGRNSEVETAPARAVAPLRRSQIVVVGVVAAGVLIGGALVAVVPSLGDWDGREISVTNRCGIDLYADDGRDGVPIRSGETIRWGGASEHGTKTIRLWTSTAERVSGNDDLEVTLHGDSELADDRCP